MTLERNFANYGDIVDLQDTHTKQKGYNTLSTVIAVGIALLIIAILWSIFKRGKDTDKVTEKETNIKLGETSEAIEAQNFAIRELRNYERNDAIKIAHLEGELYGRVPRYYGHHYGGHGHGGHRPHDPCCEGHPAKSKFQEVKTFTVDTDIATLTTTC